MARVALLDVNVLVALFDGDHVHHDAAHAWFADHRTRGWATTPFTENGAIRILSNPAYHAAALTATTVREHLQGFCTAADHVFWPADVSLLDASTLASRATITHRQLTDIYLLALAVKHDGALATFDTSIAMSTVRAAAKRHLLVLGV
jgi:uncharacterized protein